MRWSSEIHPALSFSFLSFTTFAYGFILNDNRVDVRGQCHHILKNIPSNARTTHLLFLPLEKEIDRLNDRCTHILCLASVKQLNFTTFPKAKLCSDICSEYWNHCQIPGSKNVLKTLANCDAGDARGCVTLSDEGVPLLRRKVVDEEYVPAKLAPLESELGIHDRNDYTLDVIDLRQADVPSRRYDIVDFGDTSFFHGWADVQGLGSANDYCRVIGKGKRRFLSCALAGTAGQNHHYVSKMGFDTGHRNTWFMRDADKDGRDDYCRCVGNATLSYIACMKAGERGFFGGPIEKGKQYTFALPGTENCVNRTLNPFIGA